MLIINSQLSRLSLAIIVSLSLSACDCGKNFTLDDEIAPKETSKKEEPKKETPKKEEPKKETAKELTSEQRIQNAQATADPSELLKHLKEDELTLLEQIIKELQQVKAKKKQVITDILSKDGKTLDLTFQGINDSITISANDVSVASNLMISDKGQALSVISEVQGGRLLGYGSDILKHVLDTNKYTNHQPILKRSLNWLITNNANTAPTKKLTIAHQGYDKNVLTKYFKSTYNIDVNVVDCDIFNKDNKCWQQADLLVIGGNYVPTANEQSNLKATFQQYQQAKKPLLYLNRAWWSSQNARTQFLTEYGINPTNYEYGGNYFTDTKDLLSSNNRTADDMVKANDNLSNTLNALIALRDNQAPSVDDVENMIKGIQVIKRAIQQKNKTGQSVFYNPKNQLLQKMVLLADIWRDGVRYDGFNKNDNSLRYLKSSVADNWLDFNRPYTIAPKEGVGDYMPKSAYDIATAKEWETITLTLPQKNGYTAIGRASIPAKAVQIQVVSSISADNKEENQAKFSIQTGFMRTTDKKSDKYLRPSKATSSALPINKNKATDFVSPYGGALFLRYNDAQAGDKVTLKIKGGAKYAHFDFAKGMSQSEMNDAVSALQSGKFGWNTMKFVGGEIQQTMNYAKKAIGNRKPTEYINRVKTVIFDSNHIANGYNNMPLDNDTKQACTTLNWDCTSKVHNAPSVQHFVGWLAACGFMCAGQPVDAFAGVETGWGWNHELGHNTVRPALTMTFKSTKDGKTIGCGTECNNNILAGLSMLRKYEIYNENNTGANFNHQLLYKQLVDSRVTGKTGEDLRAETEAKIWSGNGYVNSNPKQAVHLQLAFLYSKLHKNQAKPNSQAVFEFFRLLNIGNRLVDKIDWKKATQADKAKLGFGAYSKKDFSNPELTFMLASKIIGYDLTDFFTLYGLPLSDTAKQSVAKLNLPKAPLSFYAQAEGDANLLANGQWIENVGLQGDLPKYPFK